MPPGALHSPAPRPVTTAIDYASHRRDLAERSLHLGLDESAACRSGDSTQRRLRPRDAAEHGRRGASPTDRRPGLPDRREREGQLLRRASVSPATGRSTSSGLARRRRRAMSRRHRPRINSPRMRPITLRGSPSRSPTASAAPFTGERWGDFVGVAQDPQVPERRLAGEPVRRPAAELGDQGLAAPDRRRDVRPDRSAAGARQSRINRRRDRHLQRQHAQDVRSVAGVGTHPGRRDRGDRQRHGHRPDGRRLRSVTTTPTSTPARRRINFPIKDTRANNVTAPVASNGTLSVVYKAAAGKKAHIIFDVTGYFLPGDRGRRLQHAGPGPGPRQPGGLGTGLTGRFQTGVPRQLVDRGSTTASRPTPSRSRPT